MLQDVLKWSILTSLSASLLALVWQMCNVWGDNLFMFCYSYINFSVAELVPEQNHTVVWLQNSSVFTRRKKYIIKMIHNTETYLLDTTIFLVLFSTRSSDLRSWTIMTLETLWVIRSVRCSQQLTFSHEHLNTLNTCCLNLILFQVLASQLHYFQTATSKKN